MLHRNCGVKGQTPDRLAKHIAGKHNQRAIKIARRRVNFPLRNKEYRNLTPLIIHLQIRNTTTTWKPTTCNILKNNS